MTLYLFILGLKSVEDPCAIVIIFGNNYDICPNSMFLGVLYLMLCHCLRRTDTGPASLFHSEDLLSRQNDSSAWVYADTLIHNDAFERN